MSWRRTLSLPVQAGDRGTGDASTFEVRPKPRRAWRWKVALAPSRALRVSEPWRRDRGDCRASLERQASLPAGIPRGRRPE